VLVGVRESCVRRHAPRVSRLSNGCSHTCRVDCARDASARRPTPLNEGHRWETTQAGSLTVPKGTVISRVAVRLACAHDATPPP